MDGSLIGWFVWKLLLVFEGVILDQDGLWGIGGLNDGMDSEGEGKEGKVHGLMVYFLD